MRGSDMRGSTVLVLLGEEGPAQNVIFL